MNHRDAQVHRCVVDQVASWEVVGTVHDDVVAGHDLKRVLCAEPFGVWLDLHFWIECGQCIPGRFDLEHADAVCVMKDLPLQIGNLDDVVVDHANRAHACCGQIERCRRAEPTRPEHEDLGVEQLPLSGGPHPAQNQVTGVSRSLFG